MASEHERFLAEEHFKAPVVVTDYPRDIKAFYMRLNDDERTVAAMDVLRPVLVKSSVVVSVKSDSMSLTHGWMPILKRHFGGIAIYVATAQSPRRFWLGL